VLEILAAAWSGEPVHHRGEHYTVDGMRFLPRPVQRPGVPGAGRGLLRQAQANAPGGAAPGLLPDRAGPRRTLAEVVADLAALRREAGRDPTERYDAVVALPPGSDPAPYVAAGATWGLVEFPLGCGIRRPGARCDPRRPGGPA
jgi:alkanesulfonate monooxygenase SsuD/methylene tetrahydromethanopterin reductase-like flavin-dependent oxidoreductase (luciferase family)